MITKKVCNDNKRESPAQKFVVKITATTEVVKPLPDGLCNRSTSDWISCSERMPNSAERCIVFMSDGNIQFGWWNAQHYEGGQDGGVWCVLYPGKPAKLFRVKNVPYWMPLPNPPGGDKND